MRQVKPYMGRSTYLRLESGERVADISQIAQVCEVFGLDYMTFMERASQRVADYEVKDQLAERRKDRRPPTEADFQSGRAAALREDKGDDV